MNLENQHKADVRRIIVIDDNPDIHNDYATILKSSRDQSDLEALESALFGDQIPKIECKDLQYHLEYALQGQEGVQKIASALNQSEPFQLAFVDMRMPPGWDGLRTIQEIWKLDSQIQIVLATAYSDYSWEQINQALGMTENLLILKKPFDSSEVAQMASTLTQKWLLAREAQFKQDDLESLVDSRTEALLKSNAQLKKEIAERKTLQEQLLRSQKMEAIGTLAAGVAHDLNNILSGVLSYPELIMMNMSPEDPLYRPLTIIRQSGQKAAAIVQDLLTMARRKVAVTEPLDLRKIVTGFIEGPTCQAICKHHPQVRITTQLDTGSRMVLASAVHLEKVVMNLVSNAAESMPDGGTILIELHEVSLDAPLSGYAEIIPGNYVRLTVSDQGFGISPKDMKHIFEPFFTKKKLGRSGTGLGMTVVWDTIDSHNGYIEVNSKPGQGTTIAVYLPVTRHKAQVKRSPSKLARLGGHEEQILVVDDVPEQRKIATAIFNELGYRPEAVDSGESALAYLKTRPVDLILLDMIMDPGIDGLETLERVLAFNPGQKVIIASGYTKTKRIQAAMALGAAYVNKPYRLEEIAHVVHKALNDTATNPGNRSNLK